ncbi:hypothetical protein GCM10009830_04260 [Glycomyces endophyticus]|uniref:Uncharacterized protein n=1 Tax=Glycomyces endophyticus TaxID=480996 RepID=A0ABP4RYD6_9ACTN
MTAALKAPEPQSAAASGPVHGSPAWTGGRVRNRRERQRAARCFTGPEPARRSRRPEPSKATPSIALPSGQSRRGTVESP